MFFAFPGLGLPLGGLPVAAGSRLDELLVAFKLVFEFLGLSGGLTGDLPFWGKRLFKGFLSSLEDESESES